MITSNVKRLAIVGLPGSGKTTIARALLVDYDADNESFSRRMDLAYIHGDEVLAENILNICSVVPCFVAEHMCLAQILSMAKEPCIDLVLFLNLAPIICRERFKRRANHLLETEVSLEDLYNEITLCVDNLRRRNISVAEFSLEDEIYVDSAKLTGTKLWHYIESKANI